MVLERQKTPQTPVKTRSSLRFPLSSPYSGKSPLPIPILLPSQYGLGASADSEIETLERTGLEDTGTFEKNRKIELFDKSITRPEPEIPPVGCDLGDMPFFNSARQKAFESASLGIQKQMKQWRRINDTVVDMNESLGSYLFGLYQNAWCVSLDENITYENIEKLETVRNLEAKVEELKSKLAVETKKRNMESRSKEQEPRRNSMPQPPFIPRFQRKIGANPNRSTNSQREGGNSRHFNGRVNGSGVTKPKPSFLKAGSKHSLFQTRRVSMLHERQKQRESRIQDKEREQRSYRALQSNIPENHRNVRSLEGGLKLSNATKFLTGNVDMSDDSISESIGDTSEVQTLGTIKRLALSQGSSIRQPRNGISNVGQRHVNLPGRHFNRNKISTASWEVKHRKPFR